MRGRGKGLVNPVCRVTGCLEPVGCIVGYGDIQKFLQFIKRVIAGGGGRGGTGQAIIKKYLILFIYKNLFFFVAKYKIHFPSDNILRYHYYV